MTATMKQQRHATFLRLNLGTVLKDIFEQAVCNSQAFYIDNTLLPSKYMN